MQPIWILRRRKIGVDREDLWNVLGIYGVGGQLGTGRKKKFRSVFTCVGGGKTGM